MDSALELELFWGSRDFFINRAVTFLSKKLNKEDRSIFVQELRDRALRFCFFCRTRSYCVFSLLFACDDAFVGALRGFQSRIVSPQHIISNSIQ